MRISEAIANDLSIPESMIDDALLTARSHVKIFEIKKKSGGNRKIFHPSKKLKTIQYWLIHNIFDKLPIHQSAMAFREGISILHNAEAHKSNRFFLKMDLKDFFPSIKSDDLIPIIDKWYTNTPTEWKFDDNTKDLIRKACFFKEDRLAIGYPSSPSISNAVMHTFDTNICTTLSDEKFGNIIYTRYADDLVFSTDKKGACNNIKDIIEKLIENHTTPDISVNHKKTRLGSSTGGTASVTGLKICSNGRGCSKLCVSRNSQSHMSVQPPLKMNRQL